MPLMLMDLQQAAALGDQGELDLFGGPESDSAQEPDRPALMQAAGQGQTTCF